MGVGWSEMEDTGREGCGRREEWLVHSATVYLPDSFIPTT